MLKDARPWTYAALFGALWGCLELSLGTVLHLGDVPMKGALMGSLGIICLLCLRRLQPHVGICLTAGTVAVFLDPRGSWIINVLREADKNGSLVIREISKSLPRRTSILLFFINHHNAFGTGFAGRIVPGRAVSIESC